MPQSAVGRDISAAVQCDSRFTRRRSSPSRRQRTHHRACRKDAPLPRVYSTCNSALNPHGACGQTDMAPWLFCTRHGKGYLDEWNWRPDGWAHLATFMTRLLTDRREPKNTGSLGVSPARCYPYATMSRFQADLSGNNGVLNRSCTFKVDR